MRNSLRFKVKYRKKEKKMLASQQNGWVERYNIIYILIKILSVFAFINLSVFLISICPSNETKMGHKKETQMGQKKETNQSTKHVFWIQIEREIWLSFFWMDVSDAALKKLLVIINWIKQIKPHHSLSLSLHLSISFFLWQA